MSKLGLQVIGWMLCLGSCGATIAVVLSHKWKTNTVEGLHHSVLDSVSNVAGLWDFCQVFPSGQTQCWPISQTSLTTLLLVCRILLLFSILLGCLAGFIALFAFKCTSIGPTVRKTRDNLGLLSGWMNALAGMCVVIATSLYIYDTMNAVPEVGPRGQAVLNEVHEAPKISVAFGVLWFFSSAVLIRSSKNTTLQQEEDYSSQTKPPTVQEYV